MPGSCIILHALLISLCEVTGVPVPDLILWIALSLSLLRTCLANSLWGFTLNSKKVCLIKVKALDFFFREKCVKLIFEGWDFIVFPCEGYAAFSACHFCICCSRSGGFWMLHFFSEDWYEIMHPLVCALKDSHKRTGEMSYLSFVSKNNSESSNIHRIILLLGIVDQSSRI